MVLILNIKNVAIKNMFKSSIQIQEFNNKKYVVEYITNRLDQEQLDKYKKHFEISFVDGTFFLLKEIKEVQFEDIIEEKIIN